MLASVLARASLRLRDSNKLQPARLLPQQTGLGFGEGCLSHLANQAEASSKSLSVCGLIRGAISDQYPLKNPKHESAPHWIFLNQKLLFLSPPRWSMERLE